MSTQLKHSVQFSSVAEKMQIKTTMRYHPPLHGSECHHQKIYKQSMLERVWRKGNPLALLVGMQIDTAALKNSKEIPLKKLE